MEDVTMKKTDTSPDTKSKTVYDAKRFMRRGGLPLDVSNFLRELIELRQRIQILRSSAKDQFVLEATGDFMDYIADEIGFIHNEYKKGE